MWRRKAAVVAQLLQGLTEPQIASHSRFAAARGFLAGPLAVDCRFHSPQSFAEDAEEEASPMAHNPGFHLAP